MLIAFFAFQAAAAECHNCLGARIVGTAPVRHPCPVCDGSGVVPDPEPPVFAASEPSDVEPRAVPRAGGQPREVVARVTATGDRVRHHGSGVLVQVTPVAGILLTNWHVVRDAAHGVAVRWPDGTTVQGRVMAHDSEWDLAAVAVARPTIQPVQIAVSAPRIGDHLTMAGYGPSGTYLEQHGAVTGYLSPVRSPRREFVEMKAAARDGDSGGPMFNDGGELAGVLFGSVGGRTVGSCSTRLRSFLAAAIEADRGKVAACVGGACKVGRQCGGAAHHEVRGEVAAQ